MSDIRGAWHQDTRESGQAYLDGADTRTRIGIWDLNIK
jgi:hypothetical protein